MSPWVWLLSIGGGLFLMLCGAYGARTKHRDAVSHERLDRKQDLYAGACPGAPAFGGDTLLNMVEEPNQDPSSVYLGQVCFFGSVEQRDLFEANQHKPVTLNSIVAISQEQTGRLMQRSQDCHGNQQPHHFGA